MSEEHPEAREFRIDLKEMERKAERDGNDRARHIAKCLYLGATFYAKAMKDGRRVAMTEMAKAMGLHL